MKTLLTMFTCFVCCSLRAQIAVLFGINLPWTLTCVRNYIVVPDTPAARMFCIVYDTLVSKPFFRNQVLLLCFSINGFFESR